MPNAVIHGGKIYLLDHRPSGGEQLQAPDLSSQIKELGANVAQSSFSITNETVAQRLATGNPNLTGVKTYGMDQTDFENVHLVEVKPPQGVSAEKFVAALNSYDPKTNSYTNPALADELKQYHAKTEALKAQQRAESISQISGKDPHKTVTELIQHNMDALRRGHPEYTTVYDPTTGTFRITHTENDTVLSVKPGIPNPDHPDQLHLEISIQDTRARARGADRPLFGKDNHHIQNLGALLEGVVPSTQPTDIQSLLRNPREGQKEIKETISVQVTDKTATQAVTARKKAVEAEETANRFLAKAAEKDEGKTPPKTAPSLEATAPQGAPQAAPQPAATFEDLLKKAPARRNLDSPTTPPPPTGDFAALLNRPISGKPSDRDTRGPELGEAVPHRPDNPSHTAPAHTAPQTPQSPQPAQPPAQAARPVYSHSREHTANVLIMMGDPVHTGNGASIRLDHLSSGQIDAYKQTLERMQIRYEDRISNLGGGQFLHLDSEAASRLTAAQNVAKSQVVTDPKRQAEITLLGVHAEKMSDGSTRLPNPDHHSEHVTRALDTLGIPYAKSTTTGAITLSQQNAIAFESMKQSATNFVRHHATAPSPSAAASGPTSSQQPSPTPSAGGAPATSAQGAPATSAQGAATTNAQGAATTNAQGAATTNAQGAATTNAQGAATTNAQGAATTNAQGAATTNAQGAQTPSSPPSAPPRGPGASGGLQNQPHPSDGQAVTMGSLALKPEPVAPLDLQPNPTTQVVDPAKAKPAANTTHQPNLQLNPTTQVVDPAKAKPAANTAHQQSPSTLGKVGAAVGKAELGLNAAAQAAQGNVVGAVTTVAEGVATNVAVGKASETAAKLLAKQGLKSAGVIVGAAATIGFGAAAVIDKAKSGRYAAAGIEGVAVLGEAVGNLLPSGVVGAGLRETFRAAVKHTIGEKYAPEKSGLRQAAELAADVGGKIVAQNQFKSMPTTKLREAIAHDETLPKTVAINGKSVALTEALDDKAFRTKFIDNLEKAEAKGHDLGAQIAMIKAYDNKLAVPPPHVAVAQKPSPHVQMYGV